MPDQVEIESNFVKFPTAFHTAWSYAKHGPRHLFMYTAGRFAPVRHCAVWLNSLVRPAQKGLPTVSSDLQPVNTAEAAARIRRYGVVEGLCLSPATVKELLTYCSLAPCYGEGDPSCSFHISERLQAEESFNRKFTVARYLDCRHACAAIPRLENDPVLRGIARGYFGAEPVLIGSRIWWSFATKVPIVDESKNGQTFHYDIDGYRSLSFFFYLTDVNEEGGAHIYIRGSHRKKRLRHLVSLYKSQPDAEILDTYSKEDIRTICGKSGEGFAEDTFCFHKGSRPTETDRLLLQVRFGLRSYAPIAAE